MTKLQRLLHEFVLLASLLVSAAWADDPPSQVARLSAVEGSVTFAPAGSNEWAYAPINRPMTTGDQLWVDKAGRAELHLGSTALRLGDQTSLSFLALDDQNTQLKITQGTLNLRVRTLLSGQQVEVDTPNLAFVVNGAGDYRLDVDPNSNTTRVTVWHGNGSALGSANNSFSLHDGDQITWSGTDLQEQSAIAGPGEDEFDRWALARDQREDNSVSAHYVSREVTGYEALDDNGSWQTVPQYGAVWVPRTTIVGWAPYHYGHWVWIAPWGWTWVDDAPWGFAPFHYGRWAYLGSSWCWVPGPVHPHPVYAPALVAFAGGNAFSLHVSVNSGPGVAWFPLGPGEVYRPAYGSSANYITNINRTTVVNNTVINNVTVNKAVYVNQNAPNAITGMAASAFVKGQPVQGAAATIKPQQLGQAQFESAPRIAPVNQSLVGSAKPAPAFSGGNFNRPVISTRTPPQPFAAHDELAGRFAAHGQAVPGAGAPLTQVRPAAVQPQVNVVHTAMPRAAAPVPVNGNSQSSGNQPKPVAQPVRVPQGQSPKIAPQPDTREINANAVPHPPAGRAPQQGWQQNTGRNMEPRANPPIAPHYENAPNQARGQPESGQQLAPQRPATMEQQPANYNRSVPAQNFAPQKTQNRSQPTQYPHAHNPPTGHPEHQHKPDEQHQQKDEQAR
ncbi:DUF6600 domain-containing protein [Silvimonas soli]|uniref:DUF6600 domain-containing protein n=1 Tax=Silvimonas soli TaxID=2980100 RepID=UPI0024B36E98|nr:DUF6600 domain-containing protein [Silvimonas soli]